MEEVALLQNQALSEPNDTHCLETMQQEGPPDAASRSWTSKPPEIWAGYTSTIYNLPSLWFSVIAAWNRLRQLLSTCQSKLNHTTPLQRWDVDEDRYATTFTVWRTEDMPQYQDWANMNIY